jgi:ApbE superfamily uncharacterized protein (UPF0280 family)
VTRALGIRMLPDGRRLHLQDGPIDLVIEGFGAPDAVAEAYRAAARRLVGLLDGLCAELALLRAPTHPRVAPEHPVARRMHAATLPLATDHFITPMAAVAGAVADDILAAMIAAAPLRRAYVNNGGDIALHLAPGQGFTVGLIDRPDRPSLFGTAVLRAADAIGGIATSGWRGRSFSLGIADSVTVLAVDAASADAAATIIANAVDLPGHTAIRRAPANTLQLESDLGARLVTRAVDALPPRERAKALDAGVSRAKTLLARGLILGAALNLQGDTRVVRAEDAESALFEGAGLAAPPRPTRGNIELHA